MLNRNIEPWNSTIGTISKPKQKVGLKTDRDGVKWFEFGVARMGVGLIYITKTPHASDG